MGNEENSATLFFDYFDNLVNVCRSDLWLNVFVSSSVQHGVILIDLASIEKIGPSERKESISQDDHMFFGCKLSGNCLHTEGT